MEDAARHKGWKIKALLFHIAALLFFLYIFGLCMNLGLNDPDLWWHLKTGEYIIENWKVPDIDPFAFTTPRPLSEGQTTALRSHWLSQVIFYLSYLAGGLGGVVVLRSIIVALPMAALYIWLVRRGLKPWTALIVSAPSALMLSVELFYAFERPQGFSFTLSLIVIMLLESMRSKVSEQSFKELPVKDKIRNLGFFIIAFPVFMALWSNIHAGFIVGDVIIILYLTGETVMFAFRKIRGSKEGVDLPAFVCTSVLAFVSSFVNPNLYRLFYNYLRGLISMFYYDIARPAGGSGWVETTILEFKSLYYFYSELYYEWLVFYWAMSALLILLMAVKYILRRKVDLPEVLVVSFVVFFSNYYARGLMFALAILPLYIGKSILEMNIPARRFRITSAAAVSAILAITIAFYTYTYRSMAYILKPGVTKEYVTGWYPTTAAEFVQQEKISGPMYNFYTWGGYLIWSLYPRYQVFIDGRAIDDMINKTADSILKTYTGWHSSLDAFNINFVVIPVVFRESGHVIPLAPALAEDDRWKLVFLMNNAAVFVRDAPRNSDLIYRYNIDKKNVYREIINVEGILLSASGDNPVYNITKADALFALGRYAEAKAIYERFPMKSAGQLERLKTLGY